MTPKIITYATAFLFICLPLTVKAQTQEATQLILNYEKLLQLEEILDNMYKGYKILTKGYNTIKDIAEGNFSLHQIFLDGLYAVNPAIRNYKKLPYIIRYQQLLVNESKKALQKFLNDPNLTIKEVKYMESVYNRLIDQSLTNLEELVMIVTAGKLRMNDEERFRAIDRIYKQMEDKVIFLKLFNTQAYGVVLQRSKERSDIETLRKLYGLPQ